MAIYLKEFETANDYEAYMGNSPLLPNVSSVISDGSVHYGPSVDDPSNGHAYVDFGIRDENGDAYYIATCNIGANSPEEEGWYFPWGAIYPASFTITDNNNGDETPYVVENFDPQCFPFFNHDYNKPQLTKYYTSNTYGQSPDNKTVLDPEDDAAHVLWGGNWKIPSKQEVENIFLNEDFVTHEFTADYNGTGVMGIIIRGKGQYASNSAFIPSTKFIQYNNEIEGSTSGWCDDSSYYNNSGDFWLEADYMTSEIDSEGCDAFYMFYFIAQASPLGEDTILGKDTSDVDRTLMVMPIRPILKMVDNRFLGNEIYLSQEKWSDGNFGYYETNSIEILERDTAYNVRVNFISTPSELSLSVECNNENSVPGGASQYFSLSKNTIDGTDNYFTVTFSGNFNTFSDGIPVYLRITDSLERYVRYPIVVSLPK